MELKKVTLANLTDCTAQEVFDWVVSNLIAQGRRSTNSISPFCRYRNGNGDKCAGGWLIDDAEYSEEMEGYGWATLATYQIVPECRNNSLVRELQRIHDGYTANNWKEQFIALAKKRKLNFDVVEVKE